MSIVLVALLSYLLRLTKLNEKALFYNKTYLQHRKEKVKSVAYYSFCISFPL